MQAIARPPRRTGFVNSWTAQGLEPHFHGAVYERRPDGRHRCGRVLRPRNPDDWPRGKSVRRFNAGYVSARSVPLHRARDGLEGNWDGRKLRSSVGDGTMDGVEQQPCGIQVVEVFGLTLNIAFISQLSGN